MENKSQPFFSKDMPFLGLLKRAMPSDVIHSKFKGKLPHGNDVVGLTILFERFLI